MFVKRPHVSIQKATRTKIFFTRATKSNTNLQSPNYLNTYFASFLSHNLQTKPKASVYTFQKGSESHQLLNI